MPSSQPSRSVQPPQPRILILYSTSACHLCETALALVSPVLAGLPITLQEVDISDSDELIARYSIRIPVLRFAGADAELDWPFSRDEVIRFLEA